MSLLAIILPLVVVAFLLWLINAYVPMPPGWKRTINIIAAVVTVIWLLHVLGLWRYLSTIHL